MQRGAQGGAVCRPALQPCEKAGLRRRWKSSECVLRVIYLAFCLVVSLGCSVGTSRERQAWEQDAPYLRTHRVHRALRLLVTSTGHIRGRGSSFSQDLCQREPLSLGPLNTQHLGIFY